MSIILADDARNAKTWLEEELVITKAAIIQEERRIGKHGASQILWKKYRALQTLQTKLDVEQL